MSLFVVYESALHGQQFPCQTGKGNRMKHLQIYQGLPVWRMISGCRGSVVTAFNLYAQVVGQSPVTHGGVGQILL